MSIYLWYLAIDFGIQWFAFLVAATFQTEKFYDITGSLTFVILSIFAYKWSIATGIPKTVQTGLILLWALRLGTYLFTRILRDGKDRRFDGVRNNALKFFIFWSLQGVWVIVTLLPSLVMLSNPTEERDSLKEIVGWTTFSAGFLVEVVADYQKNVFRKKPVNRDKFIQNGLWSISRHPNYLGEILLWFGIFISASSGFSHLNLLQKAALMCCPVFNAFLIIRISGIPPLEKAASRKWGRDHDYAKYLKNTPLLVPYIW